jgi:uncharacterized membrane protein YidH (DUF202 family)
MTAQLPPPPPPAAPAPVPGEPEQEPPGSAQDRTELAWSRTAIAFLAIGGAILKKNVIAGSVVLSLAVLIWSLHRIFPDPGAGAAADATRPRQLLLVTVTVTVVALIALGIAIVDR